VRLLDALVPRSRSRQELRYGLTEWIQDYLTFNGTGYGIKGYTTTYGDEKAEPIGNGFQDYVQNALQSSGVISAVELCRIMVFAQAHFRWQEVAEGGRFGKFWEDHALLGELEHTSQGDITHKILRRMLLDADFAGNSYTARIGAPRELVRLRPDWVEILLTKRMRQGIQVGWQKVGYAYYEGGVGQGGKPAVFGLDEVSHFSWYPDPLASYRGMSWLTPVVREIQADQMATRHKLKFFEFGATPNLAVSLPKEVTPEQFEQFVELMEEGHTGVENAYKTLYTGGGADVTVIGANMQQLDFKITQGAGETRIAAAARVHPVVAGLSEGMQGSSLNSGNYAVARRAFTDGTLRPLWEEAASTMEVLFPPPHGSRLVLDTRNVAFVREDERDIAEIHKINANSISQYVMQGFEPDSAVAAVLNDDIGLLKHTGLVSVQLLPPGTVANNGQQNGQQGGGMLPSAD